MKQTVAVVLALVVALMLALPASAGAPVISEWPPYDIDSILVDPSPCPGMEIHLREVGTARETDFIDAEGNVERIRLMAQGTDYVYNASNPDIQLIGHYSASITFDGAWVGQFEFGRLLQITVPGYGTVVMRAGRWSLTTGQFQGKLSLGDPKDMAQMCALLAGN